MAGITRKQFSSGLLGGAVLVWLTGCGGDESDELNELDGNVRISSNHGHFLIIPAQDLDAGVAKVYDIQGDVRDHTHSVIFTADQLRHIKEGQVVSVGSSAAQVPGTGETQDAHTHTITANPVQG